MFSWRTTPRGGEAIRPLIVAHRGCPRLAPENTISSFRMAVAAGADAFELDARLTSDGGVVVFHDRTLRRTTGARGRVSDSTVAAIRRLRAGAWFSDEFGDERVPLLEEALELAAGRVGVNIELKYDSRGTDPGPLVRRVCDIVRGSGPHDHVLISSFHHRALAHQKAVAPEIESGVLVTPPGVPTTSGVRLAGRLGSGWLIYSGGNIRKRFVARAHGEGYGVMEYTVNGRMRLRRATGMGVDGVITDDPAGTIAALDSWRRGGRVTGAR
jgi:glycerophosphoryl diester phosphodiesterase